MNLKRSALLLTISLASLLSGEHLFSTEEHQASPTSLLLVCPISQSALVKRYFAELKTLQQEERWKEIITLGEEAAKECFQQRDLLNEFSITDQLVSTYFRLGDFERARAKGERLIAIAEVLQKLASAPVLGPVSKNVKELVIDSLYKLSASIRGMAGVTRDENAQKELFIEARDLTKKALDYCAQYSPENQALKARVLFNAGAAECDDPNGDYTQGIVHYTEALSIFTNLKEEDYQERTMIRLGKAHFLLGNLKESREIIEEVKQLHLEIRTRMHLYYLDAQVLMAESQLDDALKSAQTGREIALQLHAEADLKRFDRLVESLSRISF